MPKLTRRESEARQAAVLNFFLSNPGATGTEAQAALVSGKLTGKKGEPKMGIRMVHALQRQANDELHRGARQISSPKAPVAVEVAAPLLEKLRDLAGKMQAALAAAPDGVNLIVRVTKDGAWTERNKVERVEERL